MRYSKLMKERIRRVHVLLKELGYEVFDEQVLEETYTAGFATKSGLSGGFFIDKDNKFLEFAFNFSFSTKMAEFIRSRVEELLKICYEFGCYVNFQNNSNEYSISVFTKIYFAGLNYYALKETMRDFIDCIDSIKDLFKITTNPQDREAEGED